MTANQGAEEVVLSRAAQLIVEKIADAVTTMSRETRTAEEQGEAVARDCAPLFEQLGMINDGDGWGFEDRL